jgi:predicted permease
MSLTLDIKYSARLLAKKPGFTALTVCIVAIGLGLTLYAFSLLNSLLFTPLRFADNEPVYAVEGVYDHTHLSRREANVFDLYNLQQDKSLFKDMGFYNEGTTFVGGAGEGLRKFNSTYVSWNMFEFVGVQPIIGRIFTQEDHLDGAEDVLILGHDMWQSYFNADPDVIGKVVPIDGSQPARVVGVMPEGFAFPSVAQMWQPLPQNFVAPTERDFSFLFAYAKLADGVTIRQAQAALDKIGQELSQTLPENFQGLIGVGGEYLSIEPFKKANITQYYGMFLALFVVVVLILILACINVGNLLLARVNERVKEVAIRVALGVPRKRLVLQMLLESVFICGLGGFIALLLAGWGLDVTNQVFDNTYEVDKLKPFWWSLGLDFDALMILLIAIIVMVLTTGFMPAWRSLNGDFNAVLRDGTRGALGKRAANTTKVLVVSEILLSAVVLIMATILLVSSYAAGNADYGVATERRLTAQLQLPFLEYPVRRDTEFEYQDVMARSKFFYDLKSSLERREDIYSAVYMSSLPGTGGGTSHFEIEGRAAPVYNENPYANNEAVSRNSWHALDMQIVDGRDFDHRDVEEGAQTIIINESIANAFFPDGDAVGTRIRQVFRNAERDWMTIVGVVSDTFHGTKMDFSGASYNAYNVMENWGMTRVMTAIHYSGTEKQAKQALLDTVSEINPGVGVYHVQSYDALIEKPILLVTAVSKIFLLCGVVAAFLAASGIYAVAANSIQQRTQEIGVRRALGSTDGRIMGLFMKQASWQLIIGLAAGVAVALWLLSFMSQTMIFNNWGYWLGMFGMPIVIILTVLFATYIPTRKVVQMEPSEALHHN